MFRKCVPEPNVAEQLLCAGGPLEHAAEQARLLGEQWAPALEGRAKKELIQGFYLAETMAGFAIQQALTQLPEGYRAELREQAADEARHIALFASWLEEPPVVPVPAVRQRQVSQWLVQLLVNELTGYCQFRLLSGVLGEEKQQQAVREVASDEEVHIRRLLRWLEPLWASRSGAPLGGFIRRFRLDLPGRMCQFFPQSELVSLRQALQCVVDDVLSRLPTQEYGPAGWQGQAQVSSVLPRPPETGGLHPDLVGCN